MLVDTGGCYLKITERLSSYSLSIIFNLMISLRPLVLLEFGQVLSDHNPGRLKASSPQISRPSKGLSDGPLRQSGVSQGP